MRRLNLVRLPPRRVCLVHLPPRRVCLQAGLHASRRVRLHAPADSAVHLCPGAGSGGAVLQDRKLLRAPRILPGRALGRWEVWLQITTLRAAAPNRRPLRAPRIFLGQALAKREVWLRKAILRAAGIGNRNSHRKFNLFLKETDRFYRQLLKATSRGQNRRARDFLILQEKAPA